MITSLVALPVEIGARDADKLRCQVQHASGSTVRSRIRLEAANHSATHDALRISFVPAQSGLFQAVILINDREVDPAYGVYVSEKDAASTKTVARVLEPLPSLPAGNHGPGRAVRADVDSLACEMAAMAPVHDSQRRQKSGKERRKSRSRRRTRADGDDNDDNDDDNAGVGHDNVPAVRRERVETWTRDQAQLIHAAQTAIKPSKSERRASRAKEKAAARANANDRLKWRKSAPEDLAIPRCQSTPSRPVKRSADASPTRASALDPGTHAATAHTHRTKTKLASLCCATADGVVYCRRDAIALVGESDAAAVLAILQHPRADSPAVRDPIVVSSARFKDVKKSLKAFRALPSYARGAAKLPDARVLLCTIMMKKTRLSLETATVHAHVVDVITNQDIKSSVVISEHEFVQSMLELVSDASRSSLKKKSTAARKAKKRQSVAEGMFGNNFAGSPPTANAAPLRASKSAADVFSGDSRADAWMMY
ncbi:hypothetical protein PTSG_13179 [Salpingoeca rosetta]|uniref:Uncharacterized protein n=1 Tax=Salpingoeca rosetta (strain ATCC 50818 / BSB-021) TaxID=946362 RepID=F2UT73_SALR5|nr:uncharacterized protein PTSG_13179 [Salpingoeca rosetta]EGD81332.1 hypothetical protein PTSG_13179 [Salpingoeca rosetta]|eukprot:XP_004987629.1 hypothetical protein PTSG_13179 [Salpingoeca rosetta]